MLVDHKKRIIDYRTLSLSLDKLTTRTVLRMTTSDAASFVTRARISKQLFYRSYKYIVLKYE